MADITFSLNDTERSTIKLIMDLAIGSGVQGAADLKHLRACALIWPLLCKLEAAEQAAAQPAQPPPEPQ